jgi:urea transporter
VLLRFVDSNLRGVGQVMFMNNPITGEFIFNLTMINIEPGLFILVGLFVGSVWGGICGVLGLVVSTGTAQLLKLNESAIRGGLFGYNGILLGLAFSVFLQGGTYSLITAVAVFLCSIYSTVRSCAISLVI